jgi:hypothetical protein
MHRLKVRAGLAAAAFIATLGLAAFGVSAVAHPSIWCTGPALAAPGGTCI